MKSIPLVLAGLVLALGLVSHETAAAREPSQPIRFGAISWESGALTTEILRLIVEKGYGYATETLPGSTVSMEVALARNDLQVIAEEWAGRSPAWVQAERKGQVFALGDTVKHAVEGWYVPAYVIKGDPTRHIQALAPGLKTVDDLKRYAEVFKDPESPGQGRFLNSPSGWTSEIVNSQKLKAYGLQALYVNFRTGSGAALDAEINSAISRKQPVLFYYWSPAPLMGRYDLVRLEEPPFDAKAWATLTDPSNTDPQGSSSLPTKLSIGVSKAFKTQYPDLVAVFEKVDLPIDVLNQALGEMSKQHQDARKAATLFLSRHPQVWKGWLTPEVAQKVAADL
ncbi:ABC transporter substrate-binding protein [Pseudomonas sp. S75]|uniref:ABC transporter substrate-binding protein n=1 Tax=unclassified Pseudomonas TaxID=196821 RepID=UPI00190384E9|nr:MULTISPECIES: ABC transporter substrate-binding protein [unclassified Pseudomonas]MBJ9976558.1 ABC transporter substrate-binding protein [Pseudomonas sp. S30]MBK0154374.1 ABC transporter substrate-binding protein [Pseudomonas sp. S75]